MLIMKEKYLNNLNGLHLIEKTIVNYLKLKLNYGLLFIIYSWIQKVEENMNLMILRKVIS
jgi:hypothetical protein